MFLFNISHSDYMTWVSAIVAILALLVMILIGWQIFNYVYFEKKVESRIKIELQKAEKRLLKENAEQMAKSNYLSYLMSAKSHSQSFGWELDVVLDNLSQAIDFLLEIEYNDDNLILPLITFIENLTKSKSFEINSKKYAEGVDRFIPQLKKLLKRDESIYDFLKEIEKQIDNRGELTDENDSIIDSANIL